VETDEALKQGCMKLLDKYGFVTRPLPSAPPRRTPDFEATKESELFLFELKERVDDPESLKREREVLDRGEVAESFESMGPDGRVSEKARDGVRQLREVQHPEAFRLLWLHAGGRDPETQVEQFRATLYGITQIFELGSPHLTRCYYFHESVFFRYRESLSGAVLTTPDSLQIALNTLSPRLQEFRSSALIKTFHNALLDPEKSEAEGLIYLADCPHDRREKQRILDYLEAKYEKSRLMDMQLTMATARISVLR
jgi:hypothetical protein